MHRLSGGGRAAAHALKFRRPSAAAAAASASHQQPLRRLCTAGSGEPARIGVVGDITTGSEARQLLRQLVKTGCELQLFDYGSEHNDEFEGSDDAVPEAWQPVMNEKGKLIALELPDGEGRTVEVVAELEDLADNNIIFSMVPPEKLRLMTGVDTWEQMRVREAREAGMHQEGEGKSDQYNRLVKALAGTLLGEALEGGPLPGGEPQLLIECWSQTPPSLHRVLDESLREAGCQLVDMSLSSMSGAATVYVGGDQDAVERATVYLPAVAAAIEQALGEADGGSTAADPGAWHPGGPSPYEVVHCGQAGAGMANVLAGGLLRSAAVSAMAEAGRFGQEFGVTPSVLAGGFASQLSQLSGPPLLMGDGLGPAISSHRADQQAEGARDPLAAREPGMQTVSEVAASLVLTITAGRGRVPLPLAALTAQLQHMLEAGGYGAAESAAATFQAVYGGMHRGVEEEEVALSVETLHDSLHQIESLGDPAELAEGGLNKGQSGSSAQSAAAAMKGGDSFSSFDADDDDGGDGLLSDGKPTADSEPPASKSKLGAASS